MIFLKKYKFSRHLRSFFGYLTRFFLVFLRGGDCRVKNIGGGGGYFLTACIRVKDESRFLPELIAYYVCMGFEHVYIYDNNSTDGMNEVISPFVKKGFVTVVPWNAIPAFPSCYMHFFENYGLDSKWVAFVDADEFIVEKKHGELKKFLSSFSAPALALNWRYFGGNGHLFVPDGLVIDNFTKANSAMDDHVKVIVDSSKVSGVYNSHNFFYKGFSVARNLKMMRVFGSFSSVDFSPEIWINHYVYRSKADYVRKSRRGFVDKQGAQEVARAEEKADMEALKHNDVDDMTATILSDSVRHFLNELGYQSPFVLAR